MSDELDGGMGDVGDENDAQADEEPNPYAEEEDGDDDGGFEYDYQPDHQEEEEGGEGGSDDDLPPPPPKKKAKMPAPPTIPSITPDVSEGFGASYGGDVDEEIPGGMRSVGTQFGVEEGGMAMGVGADYDTGGCCGGKKIGIEGVCEVNVRWNQLPMCGFNPHYLHMVAYIYNFFTWWFYWIVMWWNMEDSMSGLIIGLVLNLSAPTIVLIIGFVVVPIEWMFKHWAIYLAGLGKFPAIGYTIYSVTSVIIFLVLCYCFVGVCGTTGVFSIIFTAINRNDEPDNSGRKGYHDFVIILSSVSVMVWAVVMLYSIGMFILLLIKCARSQAKKSKKEVEGSGEGEGGGEAGEVFQEWNEDGANEI